MKLISVGQGSNRIWVRDYEKEEKMNYWGEDYDTKFKNLQKKKDREEKNKRDPKKVNHYVIPREKKDED